MPATAPEQASSTDAAPALVVLHGSAVAWGECGILLLGSSGAGKSDLALRLIDAGAMLVADDLVLLAAGDGRLVARPHAAPGLIELRGQGIFRLPARPQVTLELCLELEPFGPGDERLPPRLTRRFLDCELPAYRIDPRPASAVARVRALLSAERVW